MQVQYSQGSKHSKKLESKKEINNQIDFRLLLVVEHPKIDPWVPPKIWKIDVVRTHRFPELLFLYIKLIQQESHWSNRARRGARRVAMLETLQK